jgi:hypothetical protein
MSALSSLSAAKSRRLTYADSRLANGQELDCRDSIKPVCPLEVDEGNTKNAGVGGFVCSAQRAGACDA